MAWIFGVANEAERQAIEDAGYVVEEVLTSDREKQVFNGDSRYEEEPDEQHDPYIRVWVDCEVEELLDIPPNVVKELKKTI
jgi:hypothetical protein